PKLAEGCRDPYDDPAEILPGIVMVSRTCLRCIGESSTERREQRSSESWMRWLQPKGEQPMTQLSKSAWVGLGLAAATVALLGVPLAGSRAADEERPAKQSRKNGEAEKKHTTSYLPVVIKEDFVTVMARMKEAKPQVMKRQTDLLHERYDLDDRP